MAKDEHKFFSSEINRLFKDGTVRISDVTELEDHVPNNTGSLSLDYDLVVPCPEGGVVEIFGDEGSMKTSLALHIIANGLEGGKDCLFINAERSINKRHLSSIKRLRPFMENEKSTNRLKFAKITNGEEALNTMKLFASQFPKSIIVLDSVDACLPEALITGEIGEMKVGNHAKLMSDALRKLISIADDNKVALIFLNQMRSKITMYGDPNETSGGRALKYYAHQRIQLKKPGKADFITDTEGERIGVQLKYVIIKNKFNPPGAEGQIPILYGYGVNDAAELVDMCCKFGILSLGGRGGKQILMPQWNEKKTALIEETVARTKAHASKILMTDKAMFSLLNGKIQDLFKNYAKEIKVGIPNSENEEG